MYPPYKWKLDDIFHFPYIQAIIFDYGKFLSSQEYGLYKSESCLPYPKYVIKKAIFYIFDYLNLKKPLYEITDKRKYAELLNTVKGILYTNFFDTGNEEIPYEALENIKIGSKFYDETEFVKDKQDELLLTDWLDDLGWIVKGVRAGDKEDFEFAMECFKKAEDINPNSKNLKACKGILYLLMAEFNSKNGNTELEKLYMKKAAEYGNKEAIVWVQNKTC